MDSRLIKLLASGTVLALAPSSVLAQRQAPTPEQRLDRLERQVQQMQRQVFPRGRPADTAGFSDDPAATQASVVSLDQRLDAVERQMVDILRQSEENGNRLRDLEENMGKMRTDQEQRITTLEQRMNAAATAPPATSSELMPSNVVPTVKPKPLSPKATKAAADNKGLSSPEPAAGVAGDPGEDAYTEGFRLWQAGQYDQAITSLRAFTAAYPKHRRVSWANNLVGRALLDKGEPRAAADALLANYRNNPGGERAPDSLYYLGQALMKLGQPEQACKAYSELDAVYGAKVRPDLKKLEAAARTEAHCS